MTFSLLIFALLTPTRYKRFFGGHTKGFHMELGLIRKIDIDSEMQQAYLDYAMSVIVARALPDARDGLKPVQRRILYAMYDMGIRADSAYKKSARIVGEVLGKYHPHGDSAVYEAMARMAQDFSMRTLLVDGQGNFGSVDGDPPAAMRYTEARLTSAAIDILLDLNKRHGRLQPQLRRHADGTGGVACRIAQSSGQRCDGYCGRYGDLHPAAQPQRSDRRHRLYAREVGKLDDIDVETTDGVHPGTGFPHGRAHHPGKRRRWHRSRLWVGARTCDRAGESPCGGDGARQESHHRHRAPYMVNKSSLIERIADLAREGYLEGLSDLRDESDRQGMRIVLEMTKNADPEVILRDLYKRTPMQTTFSINLLALVDGEPRTLTLKQALRVYMEHRLTVIKRARNSIWKEPDSAPTSWRAIWSP